VLKGARHKELAKLVVVDVWFVDLLAAQATLVAQERSTPRLSADDAKRLADPRRCTQRLAHIALRVCIEAVGGPSLRSRPYVRGPAGKPSFDAGGPHFSLAHTHGVALIAVCREGAIGVDIEYERPVAMAPDRRAAIEAAAQALSRQALPDGPAENARFLQAWTRIEALGKYSGEGVGAVLEAIELRPDRSADGARARSSPAPPKSRFRPPPDIRVDDLRMDAGTYAALARPAQITAHDMHIFPNGLGPELQQKF
jgi:4'-phosphopantetheinyl transferase